MVNEFGGAESKKRYEEQFEFVNTGLVDATMPDMIIFREKQAHQGPDGKWERGYTLSDGSIQWIKSDDGNFDFWEKDRLVSR
jgi:hypothetical protein